MKPALFQSATAMLGLAIICAYCLLVVYGFHVFISFLLELEQVNPYN